MTFKKNKMKKLFVSIILVIISITVFAQHWEMPQHFPMQGEKPGTVAFETPSEPPLLNKSKFTPISKNNCNCIDTLYSIRYNTDLYDVRDYDSAYYVSGIVYHLAHSNYEPDNPSLLLRMKIDYSGNIIWHKIDSLMRGNHFATRNTSIIKSSDGNYIQSSCIEYDFNNPKNYDWHAAAYTKFNSNGDIIWQKLYKDTAYHHSGDWPMDIVAEDDGGFSVASLFGSDSKTYSTDTLIDYWYVDSVYVDLIRYDSLGNIKQRKKHHLSGNGVKLRIGLIMKQNDGGYIVGGVNRYTAPDYLREYYLLKVDSNFNWQWFKKFSQTNISDPIIKIIPILYNQYYFTVYRADTPIVVNMWGDKYYNGYYQIGLMDSMFNILKDTVFRIHLTNPINIFYRDLGFIRGASLTKDKGLSVASDVGFGANLVHLDSNLSFQWNRWIADFPYFTEVPYKMRGAKDGGYLIVGRTKRYGMGGWFVKTDTNGFALPNGADTLYHIGISESKESINKPLVIYPNPATDVFYLSIDDKEFSKGILEIYDLTGRLKYQQKLNAGKNSINIEELSSGMYLVRIKSSKGKIRAGKLIVK